MDDSVKKLALAEKRLEAAEGRIARRNARRAFFGALQSLKAAVDKEFPIIAKPKKPKPQVDPLEAAAKRLHWREFQKRMKVPAKWDIDLAREFNDWISAKDGHPAKPIVFDFKEAERRRQWGLHTSDRIRLLGGFEGRELWRHLLHEIAHYGYPGEERDKQIDAWNAWHFGPQKGIGPEPPRPRRGVHDRPFVLELCRVYTLWQEFIATKTERKERAT